MAKYAFSSAERFAVFATHGPKCYLCTQPVAYSSMHVDHIIPERLLEDQEELDRILKLLGLPNPFNLNDFENWLPACAPCNTAKSSLIFDPAPIILVELKRAERGAAKARKVAKRTLSEPAIGKAVAKIEQAATLGQLDLKQLRPLFLIYAEAHPEELRALIGRIETPGDNLAHFGRTFDVEVTEAFLMPLTPFATAHFRPGRRVGSFDIAWA